MGNDSIYRLPAYPSTQARKTLSPTQLANINATISSSLLQTIALPPSKRDSPAARTFVASYAKDTAFQVLQGLIWEPASLSKEEKLIRKRTLLLAEKIAASPSGLGIQTLLDLSIIYAPTNISQIKSVFQAALKSETSLVPASEADLVPAFTQLFNPAQGLYAIRKASHCISSFLHASPPEIVRSFSHSKPFILALARLYDQGLASIAHSYGGLSMLRNPDSTAADDWEPIWVQTKVDLIDAFHVVITTLLNDISSAAGRSLAVESERTFDIIFALLEVPTSSSNTPSTTPTPYLDRSLLTDYQESYSLSKSLASALRNAAEKDARLDLLESILQSLESPPPPGSSAKFKDAGVLKILLRSSGIAPGIDNRGNGGRVRSTADFDGASVGNGKGKEKAPAPGPSRVPDIDVKITQVLDILPEHPPDYIRALLEYPSYEGNPEKVIEALLDGTTPTHEELESSLASEHGTSGGHVDDVAKYVNERKNIFDDEVMDVTQLRIGKKSEDASVVLRDRTFIEQMKADILRRAEEFSDDEEEEEVEASQTSGTATKGTGVVLAFDDEDEVGAKGVKISGDGEESDDSHEKEDDEERDTSKPQSPETILELAYIRDPKLFERDAQTRRSKARGDLKAQTGWGDEQIEGWRIMLERNPRKDKILQKHEFAGNQNQIVAGSSEGASGSRGGRGGHRGRGGGGRGGGRGGRGGGGSGEGADSARERAWKDKNKASRGNHNRKRGHDKKMARAGAGPSV
ncbi:hypothetical protein D9615_005913 [Tricholomella constricta]|uniref:CUE domain-containing protein n=1 Tax=Tricholomella constricta TaxID=117010 RepID=A0A8H5H9B5_9AGAR|nr:hypothetical protein D9615_005913 [Tricholomella constricta]